MQLQSRPTSPQRTQNSCTQSLYDRDNQNNAVKFVIFTVCIVLATTIYGILSVI